MSSFENVPNPSAPKPETNLVVIDGKIRALRADAPEVSTKDANQFIASKFQDIAAELEARHALGQPTAELDAEAAKLRAFQAEVEKVLEMPESRELVYSGKAAMVKNPYFQAEPEMLEEADVIGEEPDMDAQREELVQLMYRRDQLLKKRDELMGVIKESVSTPKEWGTAALKNEAAAIETPAIYPNYFPEDTVANRAAEKMKFEAAAREEASKGERRSAAEPLREVLDELDDVQEQIAKKETNVAFLEKKYGTGDHREAA